MMRLPTKESLRDELVSHLRTSLDVVERAHEAAQEAATHEEARPENDKDTRGLEQSYVARGQAMRVGQLRAGIAAVHNMPLPTFGEDQPAALGALVVAEEDERGFAFFLAPSGGGTMLSQGTVRAVTPSSPLGQEIIGKAAGDDCEVLLDGRTRTLSIIEVR